jgi:hypothetical protein
VIQADATPKNKENVNEETVLKPKRDNIKQIC